jgi:SAM-dependent methyltransferase
MHHSRTTCRVCGSHELHRFLDLGLQPLANAFPRTEAEFAGELRFPLAVWLCRQCSLVQLLDVIDPEVLFRDYIYVTGTSDTIAAHNAAYARVVVGDLGLGAGDMVIEAASNDGSLLKHFRERGVRTLGIEPATNIAAMARAAGIETVNRFFDSAAAREVRASHGAARAVIANNVLAHVDDPVDFLAGARELLAPGGRVIVEVPYLRELLDRLEYDTIYHEHLCYFSVGSLLRLCEAAGLSLLHADRVPVHGGSLRIIAAPAAEGAHGGDVLAWATEEDRLGMREPVRWDRFAADVAGSRDALRELLHSLKRQGRTLAGYGAPAKGNTLLNYCGIGRDLLDYTVDKSPLKVGRFTPGMHLPVLPAETLQERRPDDTLILAWNFADEILRQQQAYRDAGGRFILPLPEPRVV